jgi:hypothetical protein
MTHFIDKQQDQKRAQFQLFINIPISIKTTSKRQCFDKNTIWYKKSLNLARFRL